MRPPRPIPTRRKHPTLPYLGLILSCLAGYAAATSIWNYFLGATLTNIGLSDSCLLLAALALITTTEFDILTVLYIVLVFRQIGLPLIMKPLASQPLDSHLHYPTQTLVVTFAGLAAALVGIRLAGLVLKVVPKVKIPENDRSYVALTAACAVLGVIGVVDQARLINSVASRSIENGGAAGLGSFLPAFLILALVMATARAVRRRGARWPTDAMLLTLVGIQLLRGLVTNGRSEIGLAFIVPVITAVAFGFRPRLGTILAVAAGLVLLATVVSPVILSLRSHRDKQTASERVANAVEKFGSVAAGDDSTPARRGSGAPFYDYFGVRPDLVRERFAMVKHTDVVVTGVREFGRGDSNLLYQSILNALPRFTGVEKNTATSIGNRIYCRLGWTTECITDYNSTMPVIAESYAIGGMAHGMLISLVWFFAVSAALGLGGVVLQNNVWSVFCLVQFGNALTEEDTGGFALIVRSCLLFAILIPIMGRLSLIAMGAVTTRSRSVRLRVRARQTTPQSGNGDVVP
jgi:hypothetical protein